MFLFGASLIYIYILGIQYKNSYDAGPSPTRIMTFLVEDSCDKSLGLPLMQGTETSRYVYIFVLNVYIYIII